ncbi:MAG: hypothetical protein JWP08_1528 [Bryobacterales bacterium]|nr:hypothetical protein [Bryobacterales bacterium]
MQLAMAKTNLTRSKHERADVRVDVQAHRTGIAEPEWVFEAFFTTKERGMG